MTDSEAPHSLLAVWKDFSGSIFDKSGITYLLVRARVCLRLNEHTHTQMQHSGLLLIINIWCVLCVSVCVCVGERVFVG